MDAINGDLNLVLIYDIIKILIDKVLLAVVAGGFGYVLARSMEVFRRKQTVLLELSKMRAEAIVRSFTATLDYQTQSDGLLTSISQARVDGSMDERVDDFLKRNDLLKELHGRVKNTVTKDRLLLGDDLYKLAVRYANIVHEKNAAYWERNTDALKRADDEIDSLRRKMDSYLPSIEHHSRV